MTELQANHTAVGVAGRLRLEGPLGDHPGVRVAMPLVSDHDGELRSIGTAFLVAPGLAITAAHVARDWIEHQARRDDYKRQDSHFSVAAFQLFEGQLLEWDVDAMSISDSADIAFLRFRRPGWWGDREGQVISPCATLNFNPPQVGDELRAFGFPSSEIKDGVLIIQPTECSVRVREVEFKTNIRMRPFSCLHLDGEIAGGMSGGPCFDKDWNVVAVNSRGWSFVEGPPLASAALVWSAMNLQIDLFKTGAFPAIELFNKGAFEAVGHKRLRVSSAGSAHLLRVDPGRLIPIVPISNENILSGAVNACAANARAALGEMQLLLEGQTEKKDAFPENEFYNALRRYFWELDCAIRTAIRLKGARLGMEQGASVEWIPFAEAWRRLNPSPAVLDELARLDFEWQGVNLFEVRTYAELGRTCQLLVQRKVPAEPSREPMIYLDPCWSGGLPVSIPEGLNRFMDSSRRFVERLLLLGDSSRVSPGAT